MPERPTLLHNASVGRSAQTNSAVSSMQLSDSNPDMKYFCITEVNYAHDQTDRSIYEQLLM